MKRMRYVWNTIATLVIGLGIAKTFGNMSFSPHATELLVRFAALFGAYGDEHVEDVFMLSSLLAALVIAALLVRLINALRAASRKTENKGQ